MATYEAADGKRGKAMQGKAMRGRESDRAYRRECNPCRSQITVEHGFGGFDVLSVFVLASPRLT